MFWGTKTRRQLALTAVQEMKEILASWIKPWRNEAHYHLISLPMHLLKSFYIQCKYTTLLKKWFSIEEDLCFRDSSKTKFRDRLICCWPTYWGSAGNSQFCQINVDVHVTALDSKTIDRGSKLIHCHSWYINENGLTWRFTLIKIEYQSQSLIHHITFIYSMC